MTARTVITLEDKPFSSPIIYTFKNEVGEIVVEGRNYSEAKRKLNKLTNNKKGYRLKERRL